MTEAITYSLKKEKNNSDKFYNDLEMFTQQVIQHSKSLYLPIVTEYQSYINATVLEKARSMEEYLFELLLLGVLWKEYSFNAITSSGFSQNILIRLVRLRGEKILLKPYIDFTRGILGTFFLLQKSSVKSGKAEYTTSNMKNLLKWLSATGEFIQEQKRLSNWLGFLSVLPESRRVESLKSSVEFAEWFEVISEQVLGEYTANIPYYLSKKYPSHRWHEDVFFCGKKRIEYHMNMLGAELMNNAFRDEFLRSGKKAVLLPGCMRLHTAGNCRAISTESGLSCSGCTKECQVNELTKMGNVYNFEVFIVPHESTAFARWTKKPDEAGELGIIGVACVLNLIEGGWRAKNLDIPPQCVLLDYCGCRNHWHEKGIPTKINIERLKKILELNFYQAKV